MARIYLLLGSNVEAERNLPAAVALLREHGLVAVSAAYETAPVGTGHVEPFLNAAALIETELSPEAVKRDVCAGIEHALGRVRDPADKFGPRTIDLDIGLWDDDVLEVVGGAVPDPDILRYLHAARPLADVAPGMRHPVDGRSLATIAADLERSSEPASKPQPRPDVVLSVAG